VPTGTGPSCKAIRDAGKSAGDGAYTIDPDGAGGEAPVAVYCDMTGGGWTLVLKTDGSSTAHYPDAAGNSGALAPRRPDTVAKLSDASIRLVQAVSSAAAETRVETPSFSTQVYMRGNGWSIPRYAGYPTTPEWRTGATYATGGQCYDSDG